MQHQLRAHTPNDAKALKATVATYPTSGYADLGAVLTGLGIGEAIVTVMNERGAPTPVAWTRLRAPESRMDPCDPDLLAAAVAASPRGAKYQAAIDRESAREMLADRLEQGAAKQAQEQAQEQAPEKQHIPVPKLPKAPKPQAPKDDGIVDQVVGSAAFKDFMRTAAREIARGVFKTGRR